MSHVLWECLGYSSTRASFMKKLILGKILNFLYQEYYRNDAGFSTCTCTNPDAGAHDMS